MQTVSAYKWLKMKQTKACRFHVYTRTQARSNAFAHIKSNSKILTYIHFYIPLKTKSTWSQIKRWITVTSNAQYTCTKDRMNEPTKKTRTHTHHKNIRPLRNNHSYFSHFLCRDTFGCCCFNVLTVFFFFLSHRAFWVHSFIAIFFPLHSVTVLYLLIFFLFVSSLHVLGTHASKLVLYSNVYLNLPSGISSYESLRKYMLMQRMREKKRPVSKIHTVEPGESDRKRWKCNLSNMLGALVLARYAAEQHFGQQLLLALTVHTFWMNDFRIRAKWVDKPFCMLLTHSTLAVILKVNVKLDRKQTSNNILPDWNTIAKMGIQRLFLLSLLRLLFLLFICSFCSSSSSSRCSSTFLSLSHGRLSPPVCNL